MNCKKLRSPEADEVLVVYSSVGGIPYVDLVTREVGAAVTAYTRLVATHGQKMSLQESKRWEMQNPKSAGEIEEIGGNFYLAHTADFDAFIEIQVIR